MPDNPKYWRRGRKVGQNIYEGDAYDATDTLVGQAQSVELAMQIVNAVNTHADNVWVQHKAMEYAANREEKAEELEAEVQRLRAALECIIAKFRGVQCQEPTCDGFIGGALDVARAALAKPEEPNAKP